MCERAAGGYLTSEHPIVHTRVDNTYALQARTCPCVYICISGVCVCARVCACLCRFVCERLLCVDVFVRVSMCVYLCACVCMCVRYG